MSTYNKALYTKTVINNDEGPKLMKFAIGLAVIIASTGGTYIYNDMRERCSDFFLHPLSKIIVLFCLVFVYTSDISVSIISIILFTLFYYIVINKDNTGLCDSKCSKKTD